MSGEFTVVMVVVCRYRWPQMLLGRDHSVHHETTAAMTSIYRGLLSIQVVFPLVEQLRSRVEDYRAYKFCLIYQGQVHHDSYSDAWVVMRFDKL
jgi:hypothetical protein